MKMKAEMRIMHLQAKEYWLVGTIGNLANASKSPEAGREAQNRLSPIALRRS